MNSRDWNGHVYEMLGHIEKCHSTVGSLTDAAVSPDKSNKLLDTAIRQVELACIELRRLCEEIRPPLQASVSAASQFSKTLFGSVQRMDNGWLHIRLDSLLPHCRLLGSTAYISDSIKRLLDAFTAEGGELPFYPKAHLVILEECNFNVCDAFDQDNKGFKGVLNALKGRVFEDDNQFELSLGLFTELSANVYCHIYVLPDEEAGEFHYYRRQSLLW